MEGDAKSELLSVEKTSDKNDDAIHVDRGITD